ncbi:MAG: VanZ family protein [Candidatus Omnitrophica bacterium]|nr:VanZ family protein [Candidatus Omnitrophota bacterium]MBU1924337.1 VanZ family protein [Candidatus Omnitrophota bacterium]
MPNNFFKFWLPVYVWAAAIFILSSLSSFPAPVKSFLGIENIDCLLHAFEYAVLSYLIARAVGNSAEAKWKTHFRMFAIIFSIVYGITDELHQSFVPLRQASFLDLVFDGIGAVFGQMFFKS